VEKIKQKWTDREIDSSTYRYTHTEKKRKERKTRQRARNLFLMLMMMMMCVCVLLRDRAGIIITQQLKTKKFGASFCFQGILFFWVHIFIGHTRKSAINVVYKDNRM
jgi:hypothetical protein